jgi:Uma2 family endonuclease
MEPRPRFRAPTAMTAEEYASLEEDGLRHELQAGWLVSEPRPFPRHGQIQVRVARALADFVEGRDLGVVLTECGFLLSRNPDTVRGPDVAFVRRDRYHPERAEREFFPGAPDLAVEILSPSNRPGDVHAKVADSLAAGARLVWVLDPGRGVVEIYRSLLAPRRVGEDGVLEGEDVLPGLSVPVAALLAL